MPIPKKLMKLALPGLLAATGLVFQAAGPAAAHGSAVMTGWEDAAIDTSPAGFCGFPQTGFHFTSDTFYLRSTDSAHSMTITINDFLAAPQAARSGGCGDMVTPIQPNDITIASASVDGSACDLSGGVADTYRRTNTTVQISFGCKVGTTTVNWTLQGNQNVCWVPDPTPFGTLDHVVPNPECVVANLAPGGYPDPVSGGASGHLVLNYSHT